MSFDDDDLGGVNMGQRFFGPRPLQEELSDPVLPRTTTPEEEVLAGMYEDFPFGNPEDFLDPSDKARAALTVRLLSELFRNTAFTAADPAHVQPTIFSNPVDLSGVVTVPAGASPNWTTLVSFDVAEGRWCRINGYGINVRTGGYSYDGDIVFRIIVDDMPAPTLEQFAEQRGTPVDPREVFLLVKAGQRVQLQARRTAAGGPDDVEGVLTGWTWRLRNTYEGTQAAVTAY